VGEDAVRREGVRAGGGEGGRRTRREEDRGSGRAEDEVRENAGPGGDHGWFFVLQEQVNEPLFGLDEPAGYGRQIVAWDDLTWGDLVSAADELSDLTCVNLDADYPDTSHVPAASGAARLAALLDLVTEAFGGPLFDAALELWVAARTDADLHRSLYQFERVAGRGLASLWREVAGELANHERFDALLELTMHMARGMALQKILRSDDTARRRLQSLWREMAGQALRGSPV